MSVKLRNLRHQILLFSSKHLQGAPDSSCLAVLYCLFCPITRVTIAPEPIHVTSYSSIILVPSLCHQHWFDYINSFFEPYKFLCYGILLPLSKPNVIKFVSCRASNGGLRCGIGYQLCTCWHDIFLSLKSRYKSSPVSPKDSSALFLISSECRM